MTRRRFLEILGASSGAAAVHQVMGALGLLDDARPTTRGFELTHTGPSRGKRVLILGAGLAGLAAGYELSKAGYDCQLLEARLRPGGRCVTIRRGSTETELDGKEQVAQFDEGIYFNPGPTRIPQHHLTLDYCRELGVAIEPFCNVNPAAWQYVRGKRGRLRDTQPGDAGYIAELLAKVTRQDQLDKPLTERERDALQHLVGAGTGGGDPETRQLVMFQIVGGVDRLAKAFAERLGSDIVYGAKVSEIRQRDNQVIAYYTDRLGRVQEARGDLCVCAIPAPVLKSIDADFSEEMKRAIAAVELMPAAKIGLQFKRRFWEEDDKIFGGVSQTDQSITQIFYPSSGWLGGNGLVVGCYNYGDNAIEMGKLSFEKRIERAIAEGEKIHPQYRAEFETGFSMVWHRVPLSLGAWPADGSGTKRLREPDGRIHLAGDYVTGGGGWMAWALLSGRQVAEAVHARVQKE